MSKIIAFHASEEDFSVWQKECEKYLPGFKLLPTAEITQPETISYALMGTVKQGVFNHYHRLKFVISLWAGIERFLAVPDYSKNLPLYRMIDKNLTSRMVQYSLLHVLRFHLNLAKLVTADKKTQWEALQKAVIPKDASEVTIGVMGLGEIGSAIANTFVSLGFHVIGFSKSKKQIMGVESYQSVQLHDFLTKVNILIMVLPDTKESENIINESALQSLPTDCIIINIGRGTQIDDAALIAAIKQGKVKAAVLDVFRQEPLPTEHPFWQVPQIHITPHVAGITNPATALMYCAERILHFEQTGQLLQKGLVNWQKGY